MKHTGKIFLYVVMTLLLFYCGSGEKSFELIVSNPLNINRVDEYMTLNVQKLKEVNSDFNISAFTLYDGEKTIPYQIEGNDEDLLISFVINIAGKEQKKIKAVYQTKGELKQNFNSRSYAEIARKVDFELVEGKYTGGRFQNFNRVRVPDNHTDHNALFKYEGPGWESDKVGYRFYIDWRNRIDIFGKKTNKLVLKDVGINDIYASNDSYHEMQDWGMDILKVGNSLGIGSIAMMFENELFFVSERDSVICEITKNGPVKSEITTHFYGWKAGNNIFDLTSVLSINAGSRFTKNQLTINESADNLVTGFAKHENALFFENTYDGEWSYIGLYGLQSLSGDNLGIGLIYRNQNLIERTENDDSYILILKPHKEELTYYFGAAWEQEPGGIKSLEDFQIYMNETVKKMNFPLTMKHY